MHKYLTKKGAEVPGASTIGGLFSEGSEGLIKWGCKVTVEAMKDENSNIDPYDAPKFAKERAGEIGTQTHNYIEQQVLKELGKDKQVLPLENPFMEEEAKLAYSSWINWRNSLPDLKFLHAEIVFASDEMLVGGQIDALASYLGKTILLDWKTSNYHSLAHDIQTALYYKLAIENKYEIDEVWLFYADKKGIDGELIINSGEKLDRFVQCGLKLLDVFYLIRNRRLKNNPKSKSKSKGE